MLCGVFRACTQASLRVQLQERTDPRYGMTLAALTGAASSIRGLRLRSSAPACGGEEMFGREDVSSPQWSVCDGLPRIRDGKHCRPTDRSICEPSNPWLCSGRLQELGARGLWCGRWSRFRWAVGCSPDNALIISSDARWQAGQAVAGRGYRCSTWNLREPGSGLRAVAWAWERCSKPAPGAELGAQLRVRRIRGSALLTKLLCAFPGLASKGDRRRSPSAIDGLRKAVSNQAWWCPRVAVRRPGGTRPPANSGGAACPGPDARSSRSRS